MVRNLFSPRLSEDRCGVRPWGKKNVVGRTELKKTRGMWEDRGNWNWFSIRENRDGQSCVDSEKTF